MTNITRCLGRGDQCPIALEGALEAEDLLRCAVTPMKAGET